MSLKELGCLKVGRQKRDETDANKSCVILSFVLLSSNHMSSSFFISMGIYKKTHLSSSALKYLASVSFHEG